MATSMQIFVCSAAGETLPLEVKGSDTVLALKRRLTDCTGVEECSQRLVGNNGRVLENDQLIGECLRDESSISMILDIKGGSGDDDEEEEEASPEEKFQIASYFITQSPPGEVDFVVSDTTKLVDDPTILDEKNLNIIMQKHHEDNFVIAEAGGKEAIFSAHGLLGDGKYFDPLNKRVVKADYQKTTFTETSDPVPSSEYEDYRAAIMGACQKYVDNAYNLKQAMRATKKNVVGVYASDSGDINVCISALNSKILAAFWSGGWNSQFTFNVSSKGDVKLAAMIKVRVHCFEDGNVQLVSKLEKQSEVKVGSPEETAKAIVAEIEKIESKYQGSMEEMYITLAQSAFKKMRRILPVNQEKMKWRLAAHGVAGQIGS